MKITDLRSTLPVLPSVTVTASLLGGEWSKLISKLSLKAYIKEYVNSDVNYVTRLADDVIVINYEDQAGEGDRSVILRIQP